MTPGPPADDSAADASRSASRLRQLFDAAVELPLAAREEWLLREVPDADERARLARLLAADHGAGALDVPLDARATRLGDDADDNALAGRTIGAFRLLRPLGQGGMATVFLAERCDPQFRQQVALKLLRRGLYSDLEQKLFRRERRALASLSHPNIAHLIDGGITDAGIPYLVLEYVDGEPITTWAQRARLDLSARLRLFVTVCHAVAAAHRALIVHRDLKPSNILVDVQGRVKLLDFGIAKLLADDTEEATRTGLAAMTPAYAAPEQFSGGSISTATDVYALGVLLHELLIGERPPSSRSERQAACPDGRGDATPAPIRIALKGDLANIGMKAMAAEPGERYVSAADLADDIERHLDARPVRAHPPSRWYRTRKFLRRHRGGVAVGSLVTLALLASFAITLRQAEVARSQAERAAAVSAFMVDLFEAARVRVPRDQRPTLDALVGQAQAQLASTAGMDPATRLAVLRSLGEVWLSLAALPEAESALAEAEAIAVVNGDAATLAAVRVLRADGWQRGGRDADAIAAIDAVLGRLRESPSPTLLRALEVLTAARLRRGEAEAALQLQQDAHALAITLHGTDSAEALAAAMERGTVLAALQRYPEAIAALQPAMAHWRARHPPEDARHVRALSTLAVATDALGRHDDAETHFAALLELEQRIYPDPHPVIAASLVRLGNIAARNNEHARAEALLQQGLSMQRRLFGDDHRDVAISHDALGALFAGQRRFDDADRQYRTVLDVCARAGIIDEVCTRSRNNLGQSLYRQERLDEADHEMRLALDERRRLFGPTHPTVAYSLSTLANLAVKRGDHARAAALATEAVELLTGIGHGDSRETALVRHGLAQALLLDGRPDAALVEIERALADWTRVVPGGRARQVVMLAQKAQIEQALGHDAAVRDTLAAVVALDIPAHELAPRTRALLRELGGPAARYPGPEPAAQH
jgi:eukaryotic-like serine/threonine-protein kinase